MTDMKKVLRDLADAYEREEEGERTAALAKEIEDLKAAVAAAPAAKVDDALEDVTDEERELIRAHRAGTPKPKRETKPKEEPKPRRTRPGRKSGMLYEWHVDDDGNVIKTDIPTVYNGPDEEQEVELPDPVEAEAA